MKIRRLVALARTGARITAVQIQIVGCLLLWPFGRRRRGADSFPYNRDSAVGVFVLAMLFSAPVEALILALLLPWQWLRVGMLALEISSIVWIGGYAASLAVLPYCLEEDHLRLRYGALAEVRVPYAAIAEVERERWRAPGGRDGCRAVAGEKAASFVVSGKTEVTLSLCEPVSVRRTFAATPGARILRVAVDEPDRFVAALRERAAAQAQTPLAECTYAAATSVKSDQ